MITRSTWVFVAATVSVAGSSILIAANQNADASKAELQRELDAVLQARIESAEAVMKAVQASYEAQTVTFHQVVVAARDLIEAKLAVAKSVAEEISLLEKQLDVMRDNETRVEGLYRLGTRGGEASSYFTAKRERQTAEIELLKARIRAKE